MMKTTKYILTALVLTVVGVAVLSVGSSPVVMARNEVQAGTTGGAAPAQPATPPPTTGLCDGSMSSGAAAQNCLYSKYVDPLIELLSALVTLAIVASIIYGGILYSSAEGDPGKVAAAKKRIINSLLALVAFLLLFAFLQFLVPGGVVHS